jgi:hypothetical protein
MCRSTVPKLKVMIKSFSSAKNQIILLFCKTSIKIPKKEGYSESVNRRRTYSIMTKRYQWGNQKLYIEEEQTTQWTKEKVQTTIYKTCT